PKGSGVGIILKKDTVGKHIYAQHLYSGRVINIKLKLKGKIDISITAVYGNADSSNKTTREKITKLIRQNIYTFPGKLNIIAGDFNEDPHHHTSTQILDLLNSNWLHTIPHSDPNAYTWSNSTGTRRILDHIFASENFLMVKCHSEITNVSQYFDTNHKAIINSVYIPHILNLNRNALRKTRRKKNHTEEILDNRHNIQTH